MIILSPWELLIFTLFHSLTDIGPHAVSAYDSMHYFDLDEELGGQESISEREKIRLLMTKFKMDKNRMMVILLTRLLKRLIIKAREALDQKQSVYVQALQTFCLIAQEYLIEPLASIGRSGGQGQGIHGLSTASLEYLHCMIKLLQDPNLLF